MFVLKAIIILLPLTFDAINGIINGMNTTIYDFPHQVSIEINEVHACGGSIIGSNFILTAGHCFHGVKNVSTVTVRVGSSTIEKGGLLVCVNRIILPPYYNYTMFGPNGDAALLELSESLKFSKTIQPISLPVEVFNLEVWTFGQIIGWGHIDRHLGSTMSNMLQMAWVPVWPEALCDSHGFRKSNVICIGVDYNRSFIGPSFGDDGGPFILNNTVYGIIPMSAIYKQPLEPFIGVTYFQNWIRNITGI